MKQTTNKKDHKTETRIQRAFWIYFVIKDHACPSENGSCIELHLDERET